MKRASFIATIVISLLISIGCHKKAPQDSGSEQNNSDIIQNAESNGITQNPMNSETEQNSDTFKYTITTGDRIELLKNAENGKEENLQITIFIYVNSVDDTYPVKYDLDCEGDGEFEFTGLTESHHCTYKPNSGTHQIWLRGDIPSINLCMNENIDHYFKEIDDIFRIGYISNEQTLIKNQNAEAVISVDSWGNIHWKSMNQFAASCEKLNKIPSNAPNLSEVTDMSKMFWGARSFNQPIESWNVSNVTDMHYMFWGASSFNQPLEKWNVSNVTNMSGMFEGAISFNQPLEKWNVSNVTNMREMFYGAISFNQPLEKWDVSNVTDMSSMFYGAISFNQPLEEWDVSNVTDMNWMFRNAISFNQPVEKWNISNVKYMEHMFHGAGSFDKFPATWVVPPSDDMLKGTKVEALQEKLQIRELPPRCTDEDSPFKNISISKSETEWGYIQTATAHWFDNFSVFHEIPVFNGETNAIKKMNKVLADVQKNFLNGTNGSLLKAWSDECVLSDDDEIHEYSYQAGVIKSEKVTSVVLNKYSYFGNGEIYDYETYNFNNDTGDLLNLKDIYPYTDDEIKKMIKSALIDALKAKSNDDYEWLKKIDDDDDFEWIDWDTIDEMEIDDFKFYITEEGSGHILFGTNEIADGRFRYDFDLPKTKDMFKKKPSK